ncbi:MAG: ribosome silencing factor [Deltaproteobacteria bacterium]|nr:ribosome silencing factor [Deltaproteobacteria bacterium]
MKKKEAALLLEPYVRAALGRKAGDMVILDLHGICDVADAFVICSGRSNRQVSAIAEHIEKQLKTCGIRPLGIEGAREGQWALLDYGEVIIHVFYEPVRQFYDLEGLWSDAGRIEVEEVVDPSLLIQEISDRGEERE